MSETTTRRISRRPVLLGMVAIAALAMMLGFVFWQSTWNGTGKTSVTDEIPARLLWWRYDEESYAHRFDHSAEADPAHATVKVLESGLVGIKDGDITTQMSLRRSSVRGDRTCYTLKGANGDDRSGVFWLPTGWSVEHPEGMWLFMIKDTNEYWPYSEWMVIRPDGSASYGIVGKDITEMNDDEVASFEREGTWVSEPLGAGTCFRFGFDTFGIIAYVED